MGLSVLCADSRIICAIVDVILRCSEPVHLHQVPCLTLNVSNVSRFVCLPDLTGDCEAISNSISVVIPTLNAGPEFRSLLQKLRQQKGIGDVEIIVVDSGSRDDTV